MALGRRAAASFGVDARVMDDRIHATHCVDLVCDASDLGGAAEIADDNPRGTRREFGDGRGAARRSGVQHHLMAVIKKRLRRRAAEPVCAASNEDDRHPLLLSTLTSAAVSDTGLVRIAEAGVPFAIERWWVCCRDANGRGAFEEPVPSLARSSHRFRAEQYRNSVPKFERLHHILCGGLVFLEMSRLEVRLVRVDVRIHLEDEDMSWILLVGHRI